MVSKIAVFSAIADPLPFHLRTEEYAIGFLPGEFYLHDSSILFSGSLRATLTFLLSSLFSLSALAEAKPQPTTPSLTPVASTFNDITHPVPLFAVDAAWPTLPDNWILGQVPGLSVDASDNVWIAQRPASAPRLSLGLENRSAICCERAPEVIKFSPDGKMLAAWAVSPWRRTLKA